MVEPQTDLVCVLGQDQGGVEVATVVRDDGLADGEEPELDARFVIVQMALRPHQPSHRDRGVAAVEMIEAQLHRVERGLGILPGSRIARVRTLACGGRFIPARQPPGRIRESFEILRGEPSGIDRVQRLERLGPGVPREGIARPVDVGRSLGLLRLSSGSRRVRRWRA